MTADVNGTWVAAKTGDLNGVYYTYQVEIDGKTDEACDTYARTTGVNGKRAMVRKYIVDSVKYWADEYHMDGFRFDLVGLIDTETINQVVEEAHKTHPNVIFYGEGWTMSTQMTKAGYTMTTQPKSTQVPGFAFFSDTIRDALRGPVSNNRENAFLAGKGGYLQNETEIVLSVVSNHELPKIERLARDIDPECFMIVSRVTEVWGRGFSREKV